VFLDGVKWDNPCRSKAIRYLLQKLTKKYGDSRPAGKAITKDILNDMLETCGDKLIDIRDAALLLFTWGSGGRRRTEVVVADMKDLLKTPEGDFTYTIPHSKTDQQGSGHTVPVKGRAARALQKWLSAAGIMDGPLFRAVNVAGVVRGALSDADVCRIVKRRLKKAGYDETKFGAHSLRSGFVTEAGRRGKPLGDVMQLTTHRTVGTVMKYYQAGNIINNSAANLAD
jgi:integrase